MLPLAKGKTLTRVAVQHGRLFISTAIGCAVFFILPTEWSIVSRLLVSWNCIVVLFLILACLWMIGLTASQICDRYIEEDESAPVILAIGVLAALLSLAAIGQLLLTLSESGSTGRSAHVALAAATVVSSWLLVPTLFTLHYADMFYSAEPAHRPLSFPETPMPVFWDFAYFSFTIAVACQTADVGTTQSGIRKVVVAHSIISFLFNASILGFAINVTAGLFAK